MTSENPLILYLPEEYHDYQVNRPPARMPDKPGSSFSEKEVGALIQRATELYEKSNHTSNHRLNLADVEQIASDLGIPLEHVRAAAFEIKEHADNENSDSIESGSSAMVEYARLLGGEVSDEAWEEVVHAMKRLSGGGGEITEYGNTREFTKKLMEDDRTVLSVRTRNGETSVHASTHYATGAALAHFFSFIIPAVIAGISINGGNFPDIVPWLVAGGSGVGGVLSLRAYISVWKKKQIGRLSAMVDLVSNAMHSTDNQPVSVRESAALLGSDSIVTDQIDSGHFKENADLLNIPDKDENTGVSAPGTQSRARE
jgi:hypothetical protein